jgi:hypothetical protein
VGIDTQQGWTYVLQVFNVAIEIAVIHQILVFNLYVRACACIFTSTGAMHMRMRISERVGASADIQSHPHTRQHGDMPRDDSKLDMRRSSRHCGDMLYDRQAARLDANSGDND